MTSVYAGHIILTPTQPVRSGRPQRGSNPGPPDQESRALPTELPRPLDDNEGDRLMNPKGRKQLNKLLTHSLIHIKRKMYTLLNE